MTSTGESVTEKAQKKHCQQTVSLQIKLTKEHQLPRRLPFYGNTHIGILTESTGWHKTAGMFLIDIKCDFIVR